MTRRIIHIDLDAFFCAVEEQHDPTLRGKPFAVGGRPEQRGVVASCSYAARKYGIRSAMPMARALKLCPHLIVIPGKHRLYGEASRKVMERLRDLTPLVEQISIDEAFLDVTALPESSREIAASLQHTILNDLGLPCSLGVASNKLAAKIATDVGKSAARSDRPPNAMTIVPPGEEAGFLAPLPTEALWGVGPKTGAKLAELGIQTIGELAAFPETELARRFGKHGRDLALRARGIDETPIITSHTVKSISRESTFARDVDDENVLLASVKDLSESVAYRLKQENKKGATIKLKIRWMDFTTITRQATLDHPTDEAASIAREATTLFHKVWTPGQKVRLIGVGVSGLDHTAQQLRFWETGWMEDQ